MSIDLGVAIAGIVIGTIIGLAGILYNKYATKDLEKYLDKKLDKRLNEIAPRILEAMKDQGILSEHPNTQKRWAEKLSDFFKNELQLEWAVREVLEEMGIKHDLEPKVQQQGATGPDIFATKNDKGYVIEIKFKTRHSISKTDVSQVIDYLRATNAVAGLIITTKRPSNLIKKFARENKISTVVVGFPLDKTKLRSNLQIFFGLDWMFRTAEILPAKDAVKLKVAPNSALSQVCRICMTDGSCSPADHVLVAHDPDNNVYLCENCAKSIRQLWEAK
jgi:Holliday junction resolvase